MKILFVIDTLGKGGRERRMLEVIKGLLKKNPEISICLVSLSEKVEYQYVFDLPVQVEILKRSYKKDLSIYFKLMKIILSFKPDLIHAWGTMSSVYLSIGNLFSKRPLVCSVIADAFEGLTLKDKDYLRVKLITPFCDAIVSNSLAGIKAYNPSVNKTLCIYNGVDFTRFENLKSPAEVEMEILKKPKGDNIVLAMVASFSEHKDYGSLVNVAIKMCAVNKKLIFLLIGNGPTRDNLQKKVIQSELADQILFTGKRDDVESIIQIADIGLLITFTEGISNSIIEFMALGKPVIATMGGGTDEIVKDGSNGYLVEVQNENQLISKIEHLIDKKELRVLLGQNGASWVRTNFDIANKADEYHSLYVDLIKKKKKNVVYHKISHLERQVG